jgi:hypothetical protein
VLEFRLIYSGRLLGSSNTDTRAKLKHSIRKEFHPQLRRLWMTKYPLVDRATDTYDYPAPDGSGSRITRTGIDDMADEWKRFGYRFIPIITEERCLRASLDILFLRPEVPGLLFQSGDLDARVKTVFDALRMPDTLAEAGGVAPATDEDPFYVLMQDDKLISEVRVITDELLLLPKERELNAHDVFMVIHVQVKVIKQAPRNWGFR